jgi:8-oxo-dGTP diphosphatase
MPLVPSEPSGNAPSNADCEVNDARFSVAAYAVIQNDRGEVLLTRRRGSDDWVLPGGTVEEAEAPWEAVVREVAEESGLDTAISRLSGIYAKRRERDLVFVFTASSHGGEPRPSAERDRVQFVDPRNLPAQTSERDRERIADALAERPVPVLRVQPSENDAPPDGTR